MVGINDFVVEDYIAPASSIDDVLWSLLSSMPGGRVTSLIFFKDSGNGRNYYRFQFEYPNEADNIRETRRRKEFLRMMGQLSR
jgi:hypothetical protein